MKREFKDLFLYAPYDHECLNSEITGDKRTLGSRRRDRNLNMCETIILLL